MWLSSTATELGPVSARRASLGDTRYGGGGEQHRKSRLPVPSAPRHGLTVSQPQAKVGPHLTGEGVRFGASTHLEVISGTDPAGLSIIHNQLTITACSPGAETQRNRPGCEAVCS